jgi:hypothetical protein
MYHIHPLPEWTLNIRYELEVATCLLQNGAPH